MLLTLAPQMRYALHEAGALLGACPPEVRFVSRLDTGTSGALAAALSAAAARALKAAWCDAERVAKRYLVLVSTRAPVPDAWSDERSLRVRGYGGAARGPPRFRDAEDAAQADVLQRGAGAPPLPPGTQHARTDFAVVARFPAAAAGLPYDTALLAAQPHTGRWHQIRRHLSGAALHVVGDVVHGKLRVNGPARERLGLRRMFLHAATLQVALDDDGAAAAGLPARRDDPPLRVASPLPPELHAALAQLPGWDDAVLRAFYAGFT